jgi:chromosome segregation ATPase
MTAVAETLWKLNETLGELRASCDHLSEAMKSQDERLRQAEVHIVELRAELKVSASDAKLAAVEKAVESASQLVSNVHGPLVQKVSDIRADVDKVLDAMPSNELRSVSSTNTKKLLHGNTEESN